MVSNYLTPNMSLIVPVPGQEPGPTWANDLNNSLTIVDGHNHSPGYGVQINPNGLNINSDLPINGNNLTLLRSVRFAPQNSPLSAPTDIGCIYESGIDLWYNDGNGNQVQITSGGSVNATSSGISNPPASAAFVGGVLVVDQASNTPGNIKFGSAIMGNNVAGSNFVTLSPPNALASSYALTLPLTPSTLSFVTLDTSGNLAGSVSTSGGITLSMLSSTITQGPTVQRFTSGSGTYTPTSAAVQWIRVKMVGGGGGGCGGAASTPGAGGNAGSAGGSTTFGTAFLVAGGGSGGTYPNPVTGGSISIGAGALDVGSLAGTNGPAGNDSAGGSSYNVTGASGGASRFGGAGAGSFGPGADGQSGFANSGSGGGGGGAEDAVAGGGGAAGGYIEVIIDSVASSYSYSIGAGGAGGTPNGSSSNGGTGGNGIIIVEEYYI